MNPRRPRPGPGASLLLALVAVAGCRGKTLGELKPPSGTPAWDSRLEALFDDRCTPTPVELMGRAPGDVLDQRRFSQRLGYADLVVLVTVDQVWSRTLLGGKPQQRVEISLGEVLRGKLPRGAAKEQLLYLRDAEELPTDAVGRMMLLFVEWAPGESPAFRHHLMQASEPTIALIEAMVRDARAAGKLDDGTKKRRRRRGADEGT